MRLYFLLVCAIVVAAPANAAAPHVITVPQDYATISTAISAANSGDTINVNPGTYARGTQDWGLHGKVIAIRSVGGPAVTTLNLSGGFGMAISGAAELSGFTVTGGGGNFGEAIDVSGDGTLIRGNIFENNRGPIGGQAAAIVGNPASPIIDGNIFRNNTTDLGQEAGGVIGFYNGDSSHRSSPIIENNLFVNNQAAAIQLVMPSGNHPVVINNTFVNDTIAVSYASFSTTLIRDNIFANNTAGFHFRSSSTTDPTWDHNILFNSGTSFSSWMVGNLNADPQFVSATDFHLQLGSPAIGAGSLSSAPAFDFDRVPRSATSNDLGAYTSAPEPSTLVLGVGAFAPFSLRRRSRLFHGYRKAVKLRSPGAP